MHPDDPVQYRERLLGGVARLLLAGGAHDGVPPGVRRGLATGRLLRPDERRRQVRDAVAVFVAEGVPLRVLGVPEDVVVFRRPPLLRPGAVVVGPDDFVEEGISPEDPVHHHFQVVDFPVVEVQEEGARGREQAVPLDQARLQERPVVVEGIFEGRVSDHGGAVAAAPETDPVTVGGRRGPEPRSRLLPAGVEGRIDVDEVEGFVGEVPKDGQVVAGVDLDPDRRRRHRVCSASEVSTGVGGRRETAAPQNGRPVHSGARWQR